MFFSFLPREWGGRGVRFWRLWVFPFIFWMGIGTAVVCSMAYGNLVRVFVERIGGWLGALGVRCEKIVIQGTSRLTPKDLQKLWHINHRQSPSSPSSPSFVLASVDEMRESLLKNYPWIRSAIVARRLPSTLMVYVHERRPMALWQNNQKIMMVDDQGVVLPEKIFERTKDMILIVGPRAPSEFLSIKPLLECYAKRMPKVRAAVLLRSHRWDLYLANGLTIKLPLEDPERALNVMCRLLPSISPERFSMIDMRFKDSVILEPRMEIAGQPASLALGSTADTLGVSSSQPTQPTHLSSKVSQSPKTSPLSLKGGKSSASQTTKKMRKSFKGEQP